MDTRSKESRIKQLSMWQFESKKALGFLTPIRDLLTNFRDTHKMNVPHLSDTIEELNKAINSSNNLYECSTEELMAI